MTIPLKDGIPLTSIYWGFFSGGARNVHTDTILALKEQGIDHRVLHYYNRLDRGDEGIQTAAGDANYKKLHNAGIPLASMHFDAMGAIEPYRQGFQRGSMDAHTLAVQALAQYLAAMPSPFVLCLKEQPVNLLIEANAYLQNEMGLPAKPIIITLHRTDPGLQDAHSMEVLRAIEHDPLRKPFIAGYIACAESASLAYQQALGLHHEAARFKTVNNGINLTVFHPRENREKEAFVRRHFLPADAPAANDPIITLGARNSPEKNPELFLAAAWQLLRRNHRAHAVLCGTGMTPEGTASMMEKTLERSGLNPTEQKEVTRRMHCLGRLSGDEMAVLCSMSSVMALTSPTLGEADPLVLKEGMACGAIPVSTSTGDAPATIGIDNPRDFMLKPVSSGYKIGTRGLLTSQHAEDIADAWQYAIDHYEKFQDSLKIYTPLVDRALMGHGYKIAMQQLWQSRMQTVPAHRIHHAQSGDRLRDTNILGMD